MKCPECGEENQEGSKYCSKCLANLVVGAGTYSVPQQVSSASEWRGEALARRDVSPRVKQGSRHVVVEWSVYGGIILALAIALLLSVTIWGNPMPEEVADGFMRALNDKDAVAMREYLYRPLADENDERIDELLGLIGAEGSFSGLTYSTTESDYYTATVNLTGGTFSPGGTSLDVEIDASMGLFLGLDSHEGAWFVNISQVNIFP